MCRLDMLFGGGSGSRATSKHRHVRCCTSYFFCQQVVEVPFVLERSCPSLDHIRVWTTLLWYAGVLR